MRIGIVRETAPMEDRVALVPDTVKALCADGHEVRVEAGAGLRAGCTDEQFRQAGGEVVSDSAEVLRKCRLVLKVRPPDPDTSAGRAEIEAISPGAHYAGFLSPFNDLATLRAFAQRGMTAFSLQMVPRITRAQSMDALSAMATVAGYKAVVMAADHIGKFFPLLMTAAGTIAPANVLVLGAGVAGLQAIATAKRLGARVEAFDPRPAVQEQVESLGARFVAMPLPEDAETGGGYAKAQSEAFLKDEQKVIGERLAKTDIVITTALIFGRPAPMLITREMVTQMPAGSVIVDLAAEQGGNCELTSPDQIIKHNGVTILGPSNLPAQLPVHASQMFARTVTNLVRHLYGGERFDFEDDITHSTCLLLDGEARNDLVAGALGEKGS